jgi:hypothetical protein
MAKTAGDANRRPFTLYAVQRCEENTHANTTFIFCTNDRMFAVTNEGYCTAGEPLIAQWEGDKLKALCRAVVGKKTVRVGVCLKGATDETEVPLTKINDRR